MVAIDYRLIDAETSEVIATGEARGESVRKSSGIGGFGGAWGGGGGGGGIDMTSSNFGSDYHRRGDAGLRQQAGRHPESADHHHEEGSASGGGPRGGCLRRHASDHGGVQ